jgi:hypothetical protein
MKTLVLVLALAHVALAGCKAKDSAPPKQRPATNAIGEVELRRGEDACKTYVDKICTCAAQKPDLAQQCDLAKALPSAMQIALSVAANPDSKPEVVQQSYDSVRTTVAECIQETAKLPTLGCN